MNASLKVGLSVNQAFTASLMRLDAAPCDSVQSFEEISKWGVRTSILEMHVLLKMRRTGP